MERGDASFRSLTPASGRSRPVAIAFEGMGQKDPRAHQTHNRRQPSQSSQTSFAPLARERTTAALHSQKDSLVSITVRSRLMIWCNRLSETGTEQMPKSFSSRADRGSGTAIRRARGATIHSPRQGSPHFRRVRVAISSCSGAEVGRIVAMRRSSLEVGARPAEWYLG